MQVKKIAVITLLAAMVTIAGCSSPDVQEKPEAPQPGERIGDNAGSDGGTYKFHDNETGVTCYVVQNGNGEPAISCVQVEE